MSKQGKTDRPLYEEYPPPWTESFDAEIDPHWVASNGEEVPACDVAAAVNAMQSEIERLDGQRAAYRAICDRVASLVNDGAMAASIEHDILIADRWKPEQDETGKLARGDAKTQREEVGKSESPFERYLGKLVITKKVVRGDKRGTQIPKGTTLRVVKVYATFANLDWPNGGRAASQVHFADLKSGPNES